MDKTLKYYSKVYVVTVFMGPEEIYKLDAYKDLPRNHNYIISTYVKRHNENKVMPHGLFGPNKSNKLLFESNDRRYVGVLSFSNLDIRQYMTNGFMERPDFPVSIYAPESLIKSMRKQQISV